MAYTGINKSSDYFNTKLYTGNNSAGHAITGVGFQPDWTWIKSTDGTYNQHTFDAVRGVTKSITTNENAAETTISGLTAFGTDGFTLGSNAQCNSGGPFVSWNWKANGAGSANTDGSISSTVSANTTSGFSIVSYTGNAVAGATIGHGLGVVPKMIITKKLNGSPNWGVYHAGLGNASKYLELNLTSAEQTDSAVWDGANPTASLFYVGSDNKTNGSGGNYIAYCFADVTGYSKFGSYVGNGSTDGTFVYTGFKPAWIMYKNSGYTGAWIMYDNKRDPYNLIDTRLEAQGDFAESTSSSKSLDFLSNGFKMRGVDNAQSNWDGNTYIFMAFSEAPLVGSNNVPCTAR